mgnify:CR=1 FL=1
MRDPCEGLVPEEEVEDDSTGTGDDVIPTVTLPQGELIFPEFDSTLDGPYQRTIRGGMSRINTVIPQQYVYYPNYQDELRVPADATSPSFVTIPLGEDGMSERLIDTFRYCSGKVTAIYLNSSRDTTTYEQGGFNYNESVPFNTRIRPTTRNENSFVNQVKCVFRKANQFDEEILGNFLAQQLNEEWRNSSSYYSNLVPNESLIFVDTQFECPAAFFTKEIQQVDIPIHDVASVTTEIPREYAQEGEGSLFLGETDEETGIINITEVVNPDIIALNKRGLYREYARQYYVQAAYLDCPDDSVVEKFPASQVNQISEINSIVTDPLGEHSFKRHVEEIISLHTKVSFNMRHSSPLAEEIQKFKLDTILLDIFDKNSPSTESYYAQVLDERIQQYTGVSMNDKYSMGTRPNTIESPFIKINTFLRAGNEQFEHPLKYEFPLLYDDALEVQYDNVQSYRASLVFRNSLFKNFLREYLVGKERTFKKIMEEESSHSEVLAYRVQKLNATTGSEIQNFYFFNSQNVDIMEFLDTQVVYGEKYTYNIYTINFVIGSLYNYKNTRLQNVYRADEPDGQGGFNRFEPRLHLDFEVECTNHIRLIEAPYYSQDLLVADRPPIPPDVQFLPFGPSVDNLFEILFRPQRGDFHEEPVPVLPEDYEIIEKMREVQNVRVPQISRDDYEGPLVDSESLIHYRSDTMPTHYQIIYLREPPQSISDFVNGALFETRSEFPTITAVVEPNQEYYMIFRTRDRAGISNPSLVYKAAIYSYANGVYPLFEVYDMGQEYEAQRMTFERLISIEPASEQVAFNFENAQDENGDLNLETAPDISNVNMGLVDPEDSVWGRKYKLRITSNTTGRQLDVNFRFTRLRQRRFESPDLGQRIELQECDGRTSRRLRRTSQNRQASENRLGRQLPSQVNLRLGGDAILDYVRQGTVLGSVVNLENNSPDQEPPEIDLRNLPPIPREPGPPLPPLPDGPSTPAGGRTPPRNPPNRPQVPNAPGTPQGPPVPNPPPRGPGMGGGGGYG